MTVKQRLTRSYIYMFLVPLLIAALLLILGVGIALFSLETKYLPRLGLTLWKMHATLEQYETTFSSLEVFIWTYLGAVGMALLLTICFTNFVLTRSLFRHISAPLDELVAGVERIQGGNLDEPIAYDGNDEFKAACDAVDLMAAKLKAALDDEQRRQQSRKELKLYLEFGWIVSDPTVWKSMKRLRIHGYTRRRKATATGTNLEHIRYANVLNRKFKAEKPMQKIVTDVTYIKHNGKWYYLAGYLDLFNNEILEWELSDTFDNFLVMKPAERLLKRKMSTEHQVLLHSDQGVQYSSAGYCNLLKEYNVIQSMSRAGNPRDNAVMESFWGRFKDTLRKHFRYWECDDLRSTIEQAIYYFNNERPVRKLKGKPPVPYRTELVA